MRNIAYEQFKNKMMLSARDKRIPIAGHFELTPRCNLDCKMCYIHNADSNALREKELSTEEWKRIFDEAYEAGMLFASFTGGECLLRHDFKELYLHLLKKRVMVSIFTNGTLLTDDYLEFFRKYPPVQVQISLYGSNEEGYLKVTGHRGFEKAKNAIDALTAMGIPVHVAITPSKYMKDDFVNIFRFCKENKHWCEKTEFLLAPKREDSDAEDYNLTSEEIIELATERAALYAPLVPMENPPAPGGTCTEAPKGTRCSAGNCIAVVGWDGIMHPCAIMPIGTASVREMSYAEAWEKTKQAVDQVLLGAECVGCPYDKACPKCPSMRLTGLYTGHCNPDVCELTRKLVEVGAKKIPQQS